jgi:hypothetical protein
MPLVGASVIECCANPAAGAGSAHEGFCADSLTLKPMDFVRSGAGTTTTSPRTPAESAFNKVSSRPALLVPQTVAALLPYQVTANERHNAEPLGRGEPGEE